MEQPLFFLLALVLLHAAGPSCAVTVAVNCSGAAGPDAIRVIDFFDVVGSRSWLASYCTSANISDCTPCSPNLAALNSPLDELRIELSTSMPYLRVVSGVSDFFVSQAQLNASTSAISGTDSVVAQVSSLAFDPLFASCRRQSGSCLDCTSLSGCGYCDPDVCLPGGASGSTYTTCALGWSNDTQKCCAEHQLCSSCIKGDQSDCVWCDGSCVGESSLLLPSCTDQTTSNGTCPSSTGVARENVTLANGVTVQRVSAIINDKFCIYESVNNWNCKFKVGIDIGHTTPGHTPQDLSPTVSNYLEWFPEVHALGVNTIRTFALQPVSFYAALQQYNSFVASASNPLRVLHGIYPPEDALFSFGNAGGINIYDNSSATERYKADIDAVLSAVNIAGVAPYIVGYWIGACVDPRTVYTTDTLNVGKVPPSKPYVGNTVTASPFEIYLADMLNHLVEKNAETYGWQHPVSFQNCQVLDPITHPTEPEVLNDYGTIDPNHVVASETNFPTGLFLTAAALPAYPTFMRYEYNSCERCRSNFNDQPVLDPLAGYVRQLRERSIESCLVLSVDGFGTSKASGRSSSNTNQTEGGWTELEQAAQLVENLKMMYQERADAVFIFELFDEWFKVAWNGKDLEYPENLRPLWKNPMNYEQHLGILSLEPVAPVEMDGNASDWDALLAASADDVYLTEHGSNPSEPMKRSVMTFDSQFLYLLFEKKANKTWSFPGDELYVGWDTITPGGSKLAYGMVAETFFREVESVLWLSGDKSTDGMWVNSAYDSFLWLWYDEIKEDNVDPSVDESYWEKQLAVFRRWSIISRERQIVDCAPRPVVRQEIGMFGGDASTLAANGLLVDADYVIDGSVLEVRVPFVSIGFTAPSAGKAYDYPHRDSRNLAQYPDNHMFVVDSPGISLELKHKEAGDQLRSYSAPQASFSGKTWDPASITWRTRRKAGFDVLKSGIAEVHNQEARPFCSNLATASICQDTSPVQNPCLGSSSAGGGSAESASDSTSEQPFCIVCVVVPAAVVALVVLVVALVVLHRKFTARRFRVRTFDSGKTTLKRELVESYEKNKRTHKIKAPLPL